MILYYTWYSYSDQLVETYLWSFILDYLSVKVKKWVDYMYRLSNFIGPRINSLNDLLIWYTSMTTN